MATLRPNWPPGLPPPEALQTASDAVSKHYALPETMMHPVVVDQAMELAYLLTAYGLVDPELKPAGAQSSIVQDRPRKLSRSTATLDRSRAAGQPLLVPYGVTDTLELG